MTDREILKVIRQRLSEKMPSRVLIERCQGYEKEIIQLKEQIRRLEMRPNIEAEDLRKQLQQAKEEAAKYEGLGWLELLRERGFDVIQTEELQELRNSIERTQGRG